MGEKITLYHGSIHEIDAIDVSKGKPYKDFGAGFYLSPNMQAGIANLYMKKRNLSPKEFLKLDKKIDILGFIREGYDIFHLMGDQGILDEVDGYVREKAGGRPSAFL